MRLAEQNNEFKEGHTHLEGTRIDHFIASLIQKSKSNVLPGCVFMYSLNSFERYNIFT